MQQIPLQLAVDRACRFDNFWPGPNKELVDALRWNLVNSSDARWIYLQGAEGTGKSHLLQACCQSLADSGFLALYISFPEFLAYCLSFVDAGTEQGDQWVEAFIDADWLLIDDIEHDFSGEPTQRKMLEECFFQLLNRCLLDRKPQLVFASQKPLNELGFQLPDLRSRLGLVEVMNLKTLSDQEMHEWLDFKAERLGFKFEKDAVAFLLRRWPRDLNALNQALETLNTFSLSQQRRITIPAIRQALSL